jgi:hypothetical protein
METEDLEKLWKEIKYNQDFIQRVRSLLFYVGERDESRDRLALVLLAKYVKEWLEKNPEKLSDEAHNVVGDYADEIIEAGSKSGPEMPEPLRVTITYGKR